MKYKETIFSCVVDSNPIFRWQCHILINTLIHFARVPPEQIFVHILKDEDRIERIISPTGVNIIKAHRRGDGKYCNKLAQFETPELMRTDYVFLCDCDLAFVDDISQLSDLMRNFIIGKTVDTANPPLDILIDIFTKYKIRIPEIVETYSGKSFISNCNGGLLGIPRNSFKNFGQLWREYAEQLLDDNEVIKRLGKWSCHVDQISFCMAVNNPSFSFKSIGSVYNSPTHIPDLLPGLINTLGMKSPKVLHYHSSLNDLGFLKKVGVPNIDSSIDKVNDLIRICFNNELFQDYRYSSKKVRNDYNKVQAKFNHSLKILENKRKNIFIHIGTPKTASTAIQKFCIINKKTLKNIGINYPDQAIKAMNYLAFSILDNVPEYVHKIPADVNELYKSISFYSGSNLISSEAFFVCSSSRYLGEELPFRLKLLLPENCSVKIIIYLRRQDAFISSIYSQYVKLHAHDRFYTDSIHEFIKEYESYLNYFEILQNWANVFGKENIIVRIFEKQQLRNGCIFSDFMDAIDLELTNEFILPEEDINPSIGIDEVEFKRIVNLLTIDKEVKIKLLPKALTEFSNNFESSKINDLLSPRKRREIIQRCNEGNKRIARIFLNRTDGRLFYDPLPDQDSMWNSYLGLTKEKIIKIVDYIKSNHPETFVSLANGIELGLKSDALNIQEAAYMLNTVVSCNVPIPSNPIYPNLNKSENRKRTMHSLFRSLINSFRLFWHIRIVKKAGIFNAEWYLMINKDVALAGIDPVKHYILYGWHEGRDPSPNFSTKEYLAKRPDVVNSGICPLLHRVLHDE